MTVTISADRLITATDASEAEVRAALREHDDAVTRARQRAAIDAENAKWEAMTPTGDPTYRSDGIYRYRRGALDGIRRVGLATGARVTIHGGRVAHVAKAGDFWNDWCSRCGRQLYAREMSAAPEVMPPCAARRKR